MTNLCCLNCIHFDAQGALGEHCALGFAIIDPSTAICEHHSPIKSWHGDYHHLWWASRDGRAYVHGGIFDSFKDAKDAKDEFLNDLLRRTNDPGEKQFIIRGEIHIDQWTRRPVSVTFKPLSNDITVKSLKPKKQYPNSKGAERPQGSRKI